jgi:flagellar operon protein
MVDEMKIQPDSNIRSTSNVQAVGSNANNSKPIDGNSFAETLSEVQNVRFSNHAQKRLEYRNINLTEDGMTRLANAVDKAEKRGGKESLVMVDDMAFIVNVRDRLVVTALDSKNRGEGVFTQIDSVVFADPSDNNKSSSVDISK